MNKRCFELDNFKKGRCPLTFKEEFERQVMENSENTAIIFGNTQMTYSELNAKANQLARKIIERGVTDEKCVAIVEERSIECLISIVAVLKAGGAFVIINNDMGVQRINYIINDCKPLLILCGRKSIEYDANISIFNVLDEKLYSGDTSNLSIGIAVDDLAYIVYTSGSTGVPKGVMHEQKAVVRILEEVRNHMGVCSEDIVLQFANLSFVASMWEIVMTFLNGAALCIANQDDIMDVRKFEKFLNVNHISVLFSPPHYLSQIEKLNVKVLWTGSAVVYRETLSQIDTSYTSAFIHYGASETFGPVITWKYDKDYSRDKLPIGKPMENVEVYILDGIRECNVGEEGEICIAGESLARGYLNNPDLTKEKFIKNPFGSGRLYRTGDYGILLEDGNIDFITRKDDQVKVNGYRIELYEIEYTLQKMESIINATVVLKDTPNGSNHICAYYHASRKIDSKEIKEHLSKYLPKYMMPDFFRQLDVLPVNKNGKIDKVKLKGFDISSDTIYQIAESVTEEKLIRTIDEILKIKKVGRNSDLFECGVNSLQASVLINRIEEKFRKKISYQELFINSVVSNLAEFIDNKSEYNYESIPKISGNGIYLMSSNQKRIYIMSEMEQGKNYNIPMAIQIEGKINKSRLENAVAEIIRRHDILRTTFHIVNGEAVQKINAKVNNDFKYSVSNEDDVVLFKRFVRRFDLAQGPLIHVQVIEKSNKTLLFFDIHHIIADGKSVNILFQELMKLYRGEKLDKSEIQYKDYSEWMKNRDISDQKQYWMKQYEDECPVLDLPLDNVRPRLQSFQGETISNQITEEFCNEIKNFCKSFGVTEYMFFLSGLMILLSKYSQQDDIVVGSPISGRCHKDTETMIGMFVNTIALRGRPIANKRYRDFLLEIKNRSLEAYENQEFPFEELVEMIQINRDISRNPVFDVMLAVQNNEEINFEFDGIPASIINISNDVAQFDISIDVVTKGEQIELILEFNNRIFHKGHMSYMLEHYVCLLNNIIKNPNNKLSDYSLLSEKEYDTVVNSFNDTHIEYENKKCIHEIFECQVVRKKNEVAVMYENDEITYDELNRKANQLAVKLRKMGIKPDDMIALIANKSIEMVIGILGILKSGAAYVPIDSGYPLERVNYILDDCKPISVLTYKAVIKTDIANISLLDIDTWDEPDVNLKNVNDVSNLAYIIYTSGSTGKPKGVMVEHRNLSNLIYAYSDMYSLTEDDIILQFASISFDQSVWEIFNPLLIGGKLCISDYRKLNDAVDFKNYINKKGVTVMGLTPSFIKELNPVDFPYIRLLETGGSNADVEVLKKWSTNRIIVNTYGPTETTVNVTTCMFSEEYDNTMPIGRPMHNAQIYIRDKYGKLCGVGIPGEICVSGAGVAREYLNRPELTEEKFIDNPYGNGKLYVTGDLARWLDDGNIEYMGRIDQQVKIRGYRIELDEIESVIRKINYINDCVVCAKENKAKDKQLYAYLISDCRVDINDLKKILRKELPEYMIPVYIMQIESIPLNNNGKVDTKKLPQFAIDDSQYEGPRNEVEEELQKIFFDVLELEKIGIYDSFFEMGGHSLSAIRLLNKIEKSFGKRPSLKELFNNTTIERLAILIDSTESEENKKIPLAQPAESYKITSVQKSIYFMCEMENGVAYNMPIAYKINGQFDTDRFYMTIEEVTKRHEILRTSFKNSNGDAVQIIHDEVEVDYEYEADDSDINEQFQNFIKPFDLSQYPLMRVKIIERNESMFLFMDIHHIIADANGIDILISEMADIYNGKKLENPVIQFKDYSEWMDSRNLGKEKQYWLDTFCNEIPVLNLPEDYFRTQNKNFDGRTILKSIPEELCQKVKNFANYSSVTEYMVYLSAFLILLSKYSRQDDIVIGIPVDGRNTKEIESIPGLFANTLALRGKINKKDNFKTILNEIKKGYLKAYENKDFSFEQLVEALDIKPDLSRNPIFDVMFNMYTENQVYENFDEVLLINQGMEFTVSKFDICAEIIIKNCSYELSWNYCNKLYNEVSIQIMMEHYLNIVNNLVENSLNEIEKINMISFKEKDCIIREFNNSKMNYPTDVCVQEMFDSLLEDNRNNIAVIYDYSKLTYGELYIKSNQLAHRLRNEGVRPNDHVAIIAERGIEMIVGIMGIIRSGGAYVPIDPDYPKERINYILEDCNPKVIVEYKSYFKTDRRMISINADIWKESAKPLPLLNKSDDLIYIIYTSGTTGKPKGVMIEHSGIVSLGMCLGKVYDLCNEDNVLQFASFSFDSSVWEIFMTLLNGATLCLIADEKRYDTAEVEKLIADNNINIMLLPPQYVDNINCDSMKLVLSAGSAATGIVFKHVPGNVQYINEYGPTEGTVCATYWKRIEMSQYDNRRIPIGIPIPNKEIYILTDNELCGIGVPGELCIGGVGLARGYLNNEKLTKSKFINNPFENGRIYRTGDLARWLPDGNIEYLGRIDDQVKVRGFRVELDEIEYVLRKADHVKDCAVIAREENDDVFILSYIASDEKVDIPKLRAALKEKLPDYMIPSYILQIDKIPVTRNGKLDKTSLPEITINKECEYISPRNKTEECLVSIFEDILEREEIGIYDNFFYNGGHSIKAIKLMNRIENELGVHVLIKDIFRYPTVSELCKKVICSDENIFIPINKAEPKYVYEMSDIQKGIYAINVFEATTSYNIPLAMQTEKQIDVDRLRRSLICLSGRHEVLRTTFQIVDNKEVQKIHDEIDIDFIIEKNSGNKYELFKEFIKPFDLSKEPLFRVKVIIQDRYTLLFLDIHHIIADEVSIGIMLKELMQIYNESKKLDTLEIQFKDYSEWMLNQDLSSKEQYWLKMFKNDIPVLNLISDFSRSNIMDFEGNTLTFDISESLCDMIRQFANNKNVTEYMLFLSCFMVMLSQYTRQDDIVVGSPVLGRNHRNTEELMGMFVNTLPMRAQPNESLTYNEFLGLVKEMCLSAFDNQEYPFERLIEKLNCSCDRSRNPLFDVMMAYENYENIRFRLGDAEFDNFDNAYVSAKFDISMTVQKKDDRYRIVWNYRTRLFSEISMTQMMKNYVRIIESLLINSDIEMKNIDFMTLQQKEELTGISIGEVRDYRRNKCVHQLFEEQAAKTPDSIAVVYDDEIITYSVLNAKANQLAEKIRCTGVKDDDFVGLMMENKIEMVIGILGILKAGAVYVPINPQYPVNRIESILNDCNPKCLLVYGTNAFEYDSVIDLSAKELWNGSVENNNNYKDSEGMMYAIYTSGTTGKQKAAMIKHSSFVNMLEWYIDCFDITKKDNVILVASICFDLAQKNLFAPLITGGTLVMSDSENFDYTRIVNMIAKWKISIINWTPSAFQALLAMTDKNYSEFKELRFVILGGEPISLAAMKNWLNSASCNATLANTYGPTECTDIATCFKVRDVDMASVPIGKPIQNIETFIVDSSNRLVPVGMPGELCISGVGVSKGYLNQIELTNEKFIKNPFKDGILYKTGDLVRWMNDGNIEFLGRIDEQVKIRGFRIELSEIEYVIGRQRGIKNCAVIAKIDKSGEKYLCAYYVSDENIEIETIQTALRKELPSYMIPDFLMQLDEIPTTNNGKLDRNRLLDIEIIKKENGRKPETDVEKKLENIFSELLEIDNIGIKDNFFELGGHSLKAVKLQNKIEEVFGLRPLLREIFENPTIELISKFFDKNSDTECNFIQVVPKADFYPMSSVQKRIFVVSNIENGTGYNISAALRISGYFDVEKLKMALYELTIRHEALRTCFYMQSGMAYQKINEVIEIDFEYMESVDNAQDLFKKFVRPFDLGKAPLLRVCAVKQCDKILLFIDMHHIIADGLSVNIIIEELTFLYNGKALAPLRVQYKDYSEWMHSRNLEKQKEYWNSEYEDEPPVLNLPLDFLRPSVQSFEGNEIETFIDSNISQKIKQFAKEANITEYMLFMSAFMILIKKYAKQDDIVVGSPVAGRNHIDIDSMIGMFVNTLPLRGKADDKKDFMTFVYEIKNKCIKAYENQDYPFEQLIEDVAISRDISRNPIFDVMLAFQNIDRRIFEFTDTSVSSIDMPYCNAKFDITIEIIPKDSEYLIVWNYCRSIFKEDSMRRMMNHYVILLNEVISHPDAKIENLGFLGDDEAEMILNKFNDRTEKSLKTNCLQELFEQQVEENSQKAAIIFGDAELSYSELNSRANYLAKILRNNNIKPNDFVILMAERSPEMLIGLYGILKAGAAYVPMDPEYPKERIKYMISDCRPKAVVIYGNTHITESMKEIIGELSFEVRIFDLKDSTIFENIKQKFTGNLEKVNDSTDLAYMIYTSGTTGKPKGVMVEHRNAVNFCSTLKKNQFQELFVNNCRYVYASNRIVFDIILQEIELPLSNGITIILSTDCNGIIDEQELALLNQYTCIGLITTPTKMKLFLDKESFTSIMNNFSLIMVGAERFEQKLYKTIREYSDAIILNGYGPTETTCGVMYARIVSENSITIGTPIGNVQAYILENNNLCAIGEPGELCIAGAQVARGYLNQEDLTNEKFVSNPFGEGRMYLTGDLARWLPNGEIDYLGRIDEQVKIRGYRIELKEIESMIRKYDSVKDSVVICQDEAGEQRIYAYVTSDNKLDVTLILNFIVTELPDYMIPYGMMQIDRIPMTLNGKVDRGKLPVITSTVKTDIIRPSSGEEQVLLDVFKEILEIDILGVDENFFKIGGDSIKAIRIVSKLRDKGYLVNVQDIMRYRTIQRIAITIRTLNKTGYDNVRKTGKVELTPIQCAFFYEWKMKKPEHFNQSIMLQCAVANEKGIRAVLSKIVEHHDMLRCTYKDNVQYINDVDEREFYSFRIIDTGELTSHKLGKYIFEVCSSEQVGMNLADGPLMKTILFNTKEGNHLFISIHHLVVDGVSWRILLEDLKIGYGQFLEGKEIVLLPKTASFKEWSELLREYSNTAIMNDEINFWKEVAKKVNEGTLHNKIAVDVACEGTSRVEVNFDKNTTEKLQYESCKAYGTQINDILLTALGRAVNLITNQTLLAVDLEGHGRTELHKHTPVDRTIGWFTNIYPVIIRTESNIKDSIISNKEMLRKIPNNGIGYGILKYYNRYHDMDVKSDICFNYQGEIKIEKGETEKFIEFSKFLPGNEIGDENGLTHNIIFNGAINEGKLSFDIMYRSGVFKKVFIEELAEMFKDSLKTIIDNCIQQDVSIKTASDFGILDFVADELQAIDDFMLDLD